MRRIVNSIFALLVTFLLLSSQSSLVNAKSTQAKEIAALDFPYWQIQEIEPGGVTSGGNLWGSYRAASAVDSKGKLHIAYYYMDQNLQTLQIKYANNVNGAWQKSTVYSWPSVEQIFVNSAARGIGLDIDLDSNNNPHIIYTYLPTGLNDVLHYAYRSTSGNWTIIDKFDNNTIYRSPQDEKIELDNQNNIHIATRYYIGSSYGVKYINKIGNTWTSETVSILNSSSVNGRGISLDLASDATPHITYIQGTGSPSLIYAKRLSANNWQSTNISVSYGLDSSIDLDDFDEPHISFVKTIAPYQRSVYAHRVDGSWVTETVGCCSAKSLSLKLDSNNIVHHAEAGLASLYNNNSTGGWNSFSVLHDSSSSSTNLVLVNDIPNIFFTQGVFVGPLKYAVPECNASPLNITHVFEPGDYGTQDLVLSWDDNPCTQEWGVYSHGDDVVYPTDGMNSYRKEQLEPGEYTFDIIGYNEFWHEYRIEYTVMVSSMRKEL